MDAIVPYVGLSFTALVTLLLVGMHIRGVVPKILGQWAVSPKLRIADDIAIDLADLCVEAWKTWK